MFLVTGTLVGIALLLWLTREREPAYQGKTLSEWIAAQMEEIFDSPGGRSSESKSAEAIRQMGTNTVPWLLKWARYESPSRGLSTIKSIGRKLPNAVTAASFRNWCRTDPCYDRANAAMWAFYALGTNGSPAIPELVLRINDTNSPAICRRAIFMLTAIGRSTTPILVTQLSNTNTPCRANIAYCFGISGMFGVDRAEVTPVLVRCLADSDASVRAQATVALGIIAPEALTNAPASH